MTEIRGTPQNTQIREAFVKKATPPVDDIKQEVLAALAAAMAQKFA